MTRSAPGSAADRGGDGSAPGRGAREEDVPEPPLAMVGRVAAATLLCALLWSCSKESPPPPDGEIPVATVDGEPISLEELRIEIAMQRGVGPATSARQGTGSEVSRALATLVERSVVLREGRRRGIGLSESEVEEEVLRYRADFPPGGLEKTLLQEGIDGAQWRNALRRTLLYRKVSGEIAASLASVSPEEVRAEFERRYRRVGRPEQVKVRQLLFDTRAGAEGARKKMLTGAGVLAGTKEGESGGPAAVIELGYLSREDLPKGLADELFRLPAGGVSGVVEADRSYSLLLVLEKRTAGTRSLSEAEGEIREGMLRERREKAFREWLAGEVAGASVKVQEAILSRLPETEGKR